MAERSEIGRRAVATALAGLLAAPAVIDSARAAMVITDALGRQVSLP